jgi:hypothetical protein
MEIYPCFVWPIDLYRIVPDVPYMTRMNYAAASL